MSDILDRHARLSQTLAAIDFFLDIEGAYLRIAPMMQQAGELAAKAAMAQSIAKANLDIATAEAADRLRQSLPPGRGGEASQAKIDSMVPLDVDVQKAEQAHITAQFEAALCDKLWKAWEAQSRLLTKASDMMNSGWFASSGALRMQRREKMHEVRAAQTPIHRPIRRPTS